MPITETFDPVSPEVVHPSLLNPPLEDFPAVAIVPFAVTTKNLYADWFDLTPLPPLSSAMGVTEVFLLADGGFRAAVYATPICAPNAVAFMEEMICRGTRQFVFFGSSGALAPELTAGHLIVPTSAYRDEGTSYHYAPAADFIDVTTAPRLAEILTELGVPHVEGPVWTTDAFYRETRDVTRRRREQGCIAVDMEVSAIAAASQFRGVAAYHLLYAADSLAGQEWDSRILGKFEDEPRQRLARIAYEVARRI